MTAQTVSNAVATQSNGIEGIVRRYEHDFDVVLPEHIDAKTFVGMAIGALRRNADLLKAAERNRASFMNALLDCARLGHEPGTESYYLVPFGNEVVGIEGYRGEIERIYRAGAVASIKAEVVYSNDRFRFSPDMDKPDHQIDWDSDDRGTLRLVYAYAVMLNGSTSRVCVLTKSDIEAIKKEAKGASGSSSPWKKWEPQMWLKSAVHQLEKWVPTSAEYRREQMRALAEANSVAAHTAEPVHDTVPADVDVETGEIHDAELVDEEPPAFSDPSRLDEDVPA